MRMIESDEEDFTISEESDRWVVILKGDLCYVYDMHTQREKTYLGMNLVFDKRKARFTYNYRSRIIQIVPQIDVTIFLTECGGDRLRLSYLSPEGVDCTLSYFRGYADQYRKRWERKEDMTPPVIVIPYNGFL
ncbi:hypothetical protein CJU89_1162 [Yarrowia sp. B02]|nr:hypothetical protein CJU89_1162 [Yarrowia sp. B02]